MGILGPFWGQSSSARAASSADVNLSGYSSSYNLSSPERAADVLSFSGSPSTDISVSVQDAEPGHVYYVYNASSKAVTLTGGGSSYRVEAGQAGTAFIDKSKRPLGSTPSQAAHASTYRDGNTTDTFTGGASWTDVNNHGGEHETSVGMVVNLANGTVAAPAAGRYRVEWSVTAYCDVTAAEVSARVFAGSSRPGATRKFTPAAASEYGTMAGHGVFSVAASDIFKVQVFCANDIKVPDLTLTVTRI